MLKAIAALVPSAGVLFLFVVAVRSMLEGDRRERSAYARWEHEEAVRAARSSASGPAQVRPEDAGQQDARPRGARPGNAAAQDLPSGGEQGRTGRDERA